MRRRAGRASGSVQAAASNMSFVSHRAAPSASNSDGTFEVEIDATLKLAYGKLAADLESFWEIVYDAEDKMEVAWEALETVWESELVQGVALLEEHGWITRCTWRQSKHFSEIIRPQPSGCSARQGSVGLSIRPHWSQRRRPQPTVPLGSPSWADSRRRGARPLGQK